jgi:hypothetical protein
MNKTVYPPNVGAKRSKYSVDIFLAGSIEMGLAEFWQDALAEDLAQMECVSNVFNPRRTDWDSSWEQSINNPHFNEQVNWELSNIELADVVFFYFDKNTKSPITLMELGLVLGELNQKNRNGLLPESHQRIVVCCPDGFWRQGNVEIVCHRAGVKMFKDFSDATLALKGKIQDKFVSSKLF